MKCKAQRSCFTTTVLSCSCFPPKKITTEGDAELTCYELFPIAIPLLWGKKDAFLKSTVELQRRVSYFNYFGVCKKTQISHKSLLFYFYIKHNL